MLFAASIAIAFLLSLILFTKKGATRADRILAVCIALIGCHLFFYHLSLKADPYYYPYLLVGYPFPLLHGPMLYMYTASLTGQHTYLKTHWWLHFLPALLIYVLVMPFFLLTHQERLAIIANKGADYQWIQLLQRVLVLASGAAYTVVLLWLLRQHKQRLKEKFSQTEKINLAWLRYLIYSMGVVWLAVFSGNNFIIFSLVALFVLVLAYFGIKQVGIFTQMQVLELDTPTSDPGLPQHEELTYAKDKYQRSTLSVEKQHEIHHKLLLAMYQQQLFLNPELTVAQLADALDVHPNQLSQVINSIESKTFYDYINLKRIDEFKKRVL